MADILVKVVCEREGFVSQTYEVTADQAWCSSPKQLLRLLAGLASEQWSNEIFVEPLVKSAH